MEHLPGIVIHFKDNFPVGDFLNVPEWIHGIARLVERGNRLPLPLILYESYIANGCPGLHLQVIHTPHQPQSIKIQCDCILTASL